MKQILIVKTSSLGDIIQTFPVLSYLKENYPEYAIDWVVEKRFLSLPEGHPFIRKCIVMDSDGLAGRAMSRSISLLREKWLYPSTWKDISHFYKKLRSTTYDILFDLQGNNKSGLITWCAKAKVKVGFAKDTIIEWPNLLFTDEKYNVATKGNIRNSYLSLVQQYFKNYHTPHNTTVHLKISELEREAIQQLVSLPKWAGRTRIMLCPGAAWMNKQLPNSILLPFLKKIDDAIPCVFFLSWGKEQDKITAEYLNEYFKENSVIVEKMNIPCLQNLMLEMHFVIAMDSMALHLAALAGTPTFSVFGSTAMMKYKPEGEMHHAVQGKCPYYQQFNDFPSYHKRCPILQYCPTGACMYSLTAEALFQEFYHHYLRNKPNTINNYASIGI